MNYTCSKGHHTVFIKHISIAILHQAIS